jgi:hypothetical protein
MGVHFASGGAIRLDEVKIRSACGLPDHYSPNDGGGIDDLVRANKVLAPGIKSQAWPSVSELRSHLEAGNGALLMGWESNAPVSDRPLDPSFYDRHGANGHAIYVQAASPETVAWMNPELHAGEAPTVGPIAEVFHFVWVSGETASALLFWPPVAPVVKPAPPAPKPEPAPTYSLQVAAGAMVQIATITPAGAIANWKPQPWGPNASSAPCGAPVSKPGAISGSATVVLVSGGVFKGKWVRVGPGVTAIKK